MRPDNGQATWIQRDETISLTDSSFTSTGSALAGFAMGQVLVTAFADGSPSKGRSALLYTPSVPYAPTAVVAMGGTGIAYVSFTAFDGGSPITGYTVTSNPAGGVDTGAGTPATTHFIANLVNGTDYTFTVTATNAIGTSAPSLPTGSVVVATGMVSIDAVSLNQAYTGNPLPVTVTTIPNGLVIDITYDGSSTAPTDPGSYTVVATIDDPDYTGAADTETLTISKAPVTGSFGTLTLSYDGSSQGTVFNADQTVSEIDYTYDGSSTPPTAMGSYTVVATVNDANYTGQFTGTLVIGPPAAPWAAAGTMATARALGTSTMLSNGKLLVAGGTDGTNALGGAELYDTGSNSWGAAGSLTAARYSHSATMLPSGKVLVAGGVGASGTLASAELYDPASNVWTGPRAAWRPRAPATRRRCWRTASCWSPGA